MKLLEKLLNDPRVESVWNEGPDWDNGEGWFLALNPGYNWFGAITLHERTLTSLWRVLNSVVEKDPDNSPDPTDPPGRTK